MEAAVHGDLTLLKQALLHDPLVGAVCNPEEVWQMGDEMLAAMAPWLPQYGDQPAAAATRLARAEQDGTRVKLRETRGAVRLHTQTVDEMAAASAEARAVAGASDKRKAAQPAAAAH